MKKKDIFIALLFVVFIVLITTYPRIANRSNLNTPTETNTETWNTFTDSKIGLEIQYPEELQIFYSDEPGEIANFREYEEGPGLINIQSEFVGEKTVDDALSTTDHEYERVEREIQINGNRVLVTRYIGDGTEPREVERLNDPNNGRTFYFVKNKTLYTVAIRTVNYERFLAGIKIFP